MLFSFITKSTQIINIYITTIPSSNVSSFDSICEFVKTTKNIKNMVEI